MRKLLMSLPIAALLLAGAAYSAHSQKEAAKKPKFDKTFTLVNIEYKGSKIWLPSTLIVEEGDKVQIKLINNAPSGKHGFAIDAFGIKVEVHNGNTETVSFTAKEAGIIPHYCHIHSAHIGGQILVRD